jgi:holo-[acyl-carrier protein] synthase
MPIRVGFDLVAVGSIEEALRASHGEHYLKRVYTEREVQDCRTATGVDPERLAARFAAKEATIKILPLDGDGMSLQTIEVLREPSGRVHLELTGRAAGLATEVGVTDLALSLAHEGGFAAAVVVAECRPVPG